MRSFPLPRRLLAEALGTAILVATVVGSGIMADKLAGGNQAVALLGNTIPTGAILVVLITILGPVSGAHFNPAVTLVFAGRREMPWGEVAPYIAAQCIGGIAGTALAHLMFDLAPLMIGTTARSGPSQWLAEAVATFTLVLTILGGVRYAPQAIPWLVGLVITAAYWFTASTSFANPAVTLGARIHHDVRRHRDQSRPGLRARAARGGMPRRRGRGRSLRQEGGACLSVTIYHNPACGTSRNTLALIRNAGIEPEIIEYLKTPPTRDLLVDLIARAGLTVREAIRVKGTPYHELGLDDPSISDSQKAVQLFKQQAPRHEQLLDELRLGELDLVVGRLDLPDSQIGLTFEHLYSEPVNASPKQWARMTDEPIPADLHGFIVRHIDSVSRLEALLLLRRNPGIARHGRDTIKRPDPAKAA